MRNQFKFLVVVLGLVACNATKRVANGPQNSISRLRFLGEYIVPNAMQFKGTTIGGLSGIDYDKKRDQFYIISDDRADINPVRFYTAKIQISEDGIKGIEFLDVTMLRDRDGKPYPNSKQDPYHTPDPEDLRYNFVKDEIVWSSEGERIVSPAGNVLVDPTVLAVDRMGNYKDSFELPANMHMNSLQKGPRRNGVFEGLAFSGDYRELFVDVEEPIYEDGPRAGLNDSTAWTRILKFDAGNRMPLTEYAYKIEPVAYAPVPAGAFRLNGVPAILWIAQNRLLVVERSFSSGRQPCTIRVFLASMEGAEDVTELHSIQERPKVRSISKKLLLNMDELGHYIDNIEGVSFGPDLPNGHHSLLFVSDNNFSKLQKTQFLLFEIMP